MDEENASIVVSCVMCVVVCRNRITISVGNKFECELQLNI